MTAMQTTWPSLRIVAVVMAVVLLVTFAAPARAEADVFAMLAIVSLVIAGVIIVAYLVIANTKGSRMSEAPRLIVVAVEPVADAAAP